MPVQLPQIADVALRRTLPQGRLGARYASAADAGGQVAAAVEGAGNALGQYAELKRRDEEQLANFQRETAFTELAAAEQERLTASARELKDGGQGFTAGYMGGFDKSSEAFLAEVPEREREAWKGRMAKLRMGVAQEALRAELGERDRYYGDTVAASLDKLMSGIDADPSVHAAALEQGARLIEASGLTPAAKQSLRSRWETNAAKAKAAAELARDPEGTLRKLNAVPGAVGEDGRPSFEAIAAHVVDAFEGGGTFVADDAGKGATKFGINKTANPDVDVKNLTREQAMAIYKERYWTPLGLDAVEPGMAMMAFDAAVNQGAGRAKEWLDKANGDIGKFAEFRRAAYAEAAKNPKLAKYAKGWAARLEQVTAEASSAGEQPYAALDYDDRRSLREAAGREIAARARAAEAAEQERYDAWWNQAQLDLMDGKAGAADVEAWRKKGLLTDAGDVAKANSILEAREQENGDLDLFNAAMAAGSGFGWNPFDDAHRKAIDAGWKAQGGTLEAADAVFRKTGVLPRPAASMIRGALVSTDPQRVAAAATMAGNAVARNPHAFAGIEGGAEIAKAAVDFNHYVDDMGYSAEEAASRIARANDPAHRPKVADAELREVRAKLAKESPDVGGFSQGGRATEAQRTAMLSTWRELALDRYAETGDMGKARKWATERMRGMYGNSNGRVTIYPPEKVYPALKGRHDYLYDQAAADVKAVTGHDVDPKNVWFAPLPQATAQAWRDGKPAPYALVYQRMVDGHPVLETLTGYAFTGDTRDAASEQAALSAKRQRQFAAAQAYARGRAAINPATGRVNVERGPLR